MMATLSCASQALSTNMVDVTKIDGRIRVEIDGQLFTEYIYEGYAKPILYPIIGPHRIGMTRNFPMKKNVPNEARDHPHHQSMWFTHGNVNGVDFWGIGEHCGRIVQDQLVRAQGGPQFGMIATTNQWIGPNDKLVCTDEREIRFGSESGARMIDWKVTIYATVGDVRLGDTKEGTMGIRTHPRLRLSDDPDRGVSSVAGNAANSEGVQGRDIWGKRARWVDYWGEIGGHVVGIAIFNYPSNPRHPTWWHARSYGLVAANPFGIHNFEDKPTGTGDMTIPAGESLTLRYRFVFHKGNLNDAGIAGRYKSYAEHE